MMENTKNGGSISWFCDFVMQFVFLPCWWLLLWLLRSVDWRWFAFSRLQDRVSVVLTSSQVDWDFGHFSHRNVGSAISVAERGLALQTLHGLWREWLWRDASREDGRELRDCSAESVVPWPAGAIRISYWWDAEVRHWSRWEEQEGQEGIPNSQQARPYAKGTWVPFHSHKPGTDAIYVERVHRFVLQSVCLRLGILLHAFSGCGLVPCHRTLRSANGRAHDPECLHFAWRLARGYLPALWVAEVHHSLLGRSVFIALGGGCSGAPEAPCQHCGPFGSWRVWLGPSRMALRLAGVDWQVVWMVDCALGSGLALGWCQWHWCSLCHAVVLQFPRSGCWWQVQQRFLGEVDT